MAKKALYTWEWPCMRFYYIKEWSCELYVCQVTSKCKKKCEPKNFLVIYGSFCEIYVLLVGIFLIRNFSLRILVGNENVANGSTVCLPMFFKISSFMFRTRKKRRPIWSKWIVSKWWQLYFLGELELSCGWINNDYIWMFWSTVLLNHDWQNLREL